MKAIRNIFSALIAVSVLIPATASARAITPSSAEPIPAMKSGLNSSVTTSDDMPQFMAIVTGGILAGGKQHTCYMLQGRLHIKKLSLTGTMYQHFYGDRLFEGHIGYGNIIAFTAGAEFGDRTYFLNKDSTFEHIRFKNTATGEYEGYDQFEGFTLRQEMICYTFGISFGGRFKTINYWRGVGECWSWFNCRFEGMVAPKIDYAKTLDITTQGQFQSNTTTYELDGIKDRNWGFRLIVDSRLGAKIGWMMEAGMRPGIRYELNEEGRFSNGYLRMGITVSLSVGGRKALDKPGFGREIPEN